jgi:crotonobetainyl-CoA:carnitine CoA-transferase CaiB-like acyl-CoA transferase
MAFGPLAGVRVLDLTHVWAGPLAVRMLSDLGAEVVKIEGPLSRGPREFADAPIGGWIEGDPNGEPWNRNAAYVKLARNRRSVCIDLKQAQGRATFLEMVKHADIVIENFSARAMPSLKLDYETLSTTNPKIIYLTMPGFGTTGQYRDRVAFGPIVEAMSGLTNVLGYSPKQPRNTAMALMDPIAATAAAAALTHALRQRQETGVGLRIEMSLHEAGVSFSGPFLIEHQLGGTVEPIGNRHPHMAPAGIYRAAGVDDWVAIACVNDRDWQQLCSVVESLNPNWPLAKRQQQHDKIDTAIADYCAGSTKQDLAIRLQAAGVPAGAVNTTPDMVSDPQVEHRGFFVPLEAGETLIPGTPVKLPGTSADTWTPSPDLGADNEAVLRDWLGKTTKQINELTEKGIIHDRPPA